MSIIKSTKSGKSAIPITVEYILSHGYTKTEKNIPVTGETTITLTKGKHFLTVDKCGIFWKYETRISTKKFYLETIADFDLVETYYSEHGPDKRNKACNSILNDPRTKTVNSKMWFSEFLNDIEFNKHGNVKKKKKTLDDCIVITEAK